MWIWSSLDWFCTAVAKQFIFICSKYKERKAEAVRALAMKPLEHQYIIKWSLEKLKMGTGRLYLCPKRPPLSSRSPKWKPEAVTADPDSTSNLPCYWPGITHSPGVSTITRSPRRQQKSTKAVSRPNTFHSQFCLSEPQFPLFLMGIITSRSPEIGKSNSCPTCPPRSLGALNKTPATPSMKGHLSLKMHVENSFLVL